MASRYLNNITINDAYTLPSADGTNGQIITTDGSGILSFADAAASDAIVLTVKNVSGGSLSKGTVVYVSPSANPPSGNVIEVSAADNSSASTMPALAVLNATLADDAEGEAIAFGQLSDIDTSAFTAGDAIYVNTSGGFTGTKPTGTALIQKLGMVVKSHASNGSIKIFGAFRSNDVPNLSVGKIWVGTTTNTAESTVVHLDETNNRLGINDTTPGVTLDVSGTDAIQMPAGTTAQRPTAQAGMFRYNTTDGKFEGYTDEWGEIGGGGSATLAVDQQTFDGDNSTVAFTLSTNCESENNLQVYIDGVYQSKNNFSVSGTTLTFSTAPPTGTNNIEVIHITSMAGSVEVDTFTGDGSDVTFELSTSISTENNTQVFLDGVYQSKANYSISAATITFSTAPANSVAIEVVHFLPSGDFNISAVDSGDDAIIRLSGTNGFTDDVKLVAGSNITVTPSGDDITIASTSAEAFKTISVSGQNDVIADGSTDTLNLAAGTGITLTTDAGSDTVTITSTATGSVTEAFKTISVSGQSNVVADGATDTLTLAAGSNITLTTDASTDTITIASTASGGDSGSVSVVTTPHTGDGSTVAFALDSTPGDNDAVQVYLNGVYQIKDAANYSISGSTLTFVDAPVTGTDIEFVHFVLTSGGGGGISWDTTVKTAAFTATAGEGYFVNTTSAAITVTLPSSPTAGDEVSIVDYAGTAATNNITITSSDNINGSSGDVLIDYERGGVSMVYVDSTQGWIAYNAANETAEALVAAAYDVSYLLVAGGGAGGGAGQAGGGGAGGLLESSINNLTVGNTINITVGGGGAGSTSNGAVGTDSTISSAAFTTITADGGGGGGLHLNNGSAGGSGGGAGTTNSGTTSGGAATSGQGFAGGSNNVSVNPYNFPYSGAGGGGAGAAGIAGNNQSGNAGIGATTTIISTTNATTSSVGQVSGSSLYFAGGGGGGTYDGTAGTGGLGGGANGLSGTGSSTASAGYNATDYTGGGGGGCGNYNTSGTGGNGGSGVCILKIPIGNYSGTTTGSPDEYTEGDYKILVFKTNGTYTT